MSKKILILCTVLGVGIGVSHAGDSLHPDLNNELLSQMHPEEQKAWASTNKANYASAKAYWEKYKVASISCPTIQSITEVVTAAEESESNGPLEINGKKWQPSEIDTSKLAGGALLEHLILSRAPRGISKDGMVMCYYKYKGFQPGVRNFTLMRNLDPSPRTIKYATCRLFDQELKQEIDVIYVNGDRLHNEEVVVKTIREGGVLPDDGLRIICDQEPSTEK